MTRTTQESGRWALKAFSARERFCCSVDLDNAFPHVPTQHRHRGCMRCPGPATSIAVLSGRICIGSIRKYHHFVVPPQGEQTADKRGSQSAGSVLRLASSGTELAVEIESAACTFFVGTEKVPQTISARLISSYAAFLACCRTKRS